MIYARSGAVTVKGKTQPVDIFEVLARQDAPGVAPC